MIIGPKYKIARRLGAAVFEKTLSPKFALSQAKRKATASRGPRTKSSFGLQMLEKQKVRFTYLLSEKQFSKYVKHVTEKKYTKPEEKLFEALESRLDNVVLKGGIAHTRPLARQLVSHGHITVNGRKVTTPSFSVSVGDVIRVREGSAAKTPFVELDKRLKEVSIPSWLKINFDMKEVVVQGAPKITTAESNFDLPAVLQFYRR